MCYVYVIRSLKNKRYYIGSTNNLERRLKEHNHNKIKSLKNKGPFVLVYKEEYKTLREARQRERKIKSYKGGNAFKKLIRGRRFESGPPLSLGEIIVFCFWLEEENKFL